MEITNEEKKLIRDDLNFSLAMELSGQNINDVDETKKRIDMLESIIRKLNDEIKAADVDVFDMGEKKMK